MHSYASIVFIWLGFMSHSLSGLENGLKQIDAFHSDPMVRPREFIQDSRLTHKPSRASLLKSAADKASTAKASPLKASLVQTIPFAPDAGFSPSIADPSMTEEERIISKHYPNKDDWDDTDYSNSEDYDDDTDLDAAHFESQLQEADQLDKQLPAFLNEPQSGYVLRNQPLVLRCKAAHTMQLTIKCSGHQQPPHSAPDAHVDPHTGVHMQEISASVSAELVLKHVAKSPFRCECHAWSPRGKAKSQPATIEIAYIRKQFAVMPQSNRVQLGGRSEIRCAPPRGLPAPSVRWLKHGAPMVFDPFVTMSPNGSLIFASAFMKDNGNYSCVAENIVGNQTTAEASLTVYANGGWSAWSPWTDCQCSGQLLPGQMRTRTCDNPLPMNGGAQCLGSDVGRTADCVKCEKVEIVWSTWSDWTECSAECIHARHRSCLEDSAAESSANRMACLGRDYQTEECLGGQCAMGKQSFSWMLFVGLGAICVACVALGALLTSRCTPRLSRLPSYRLAQTEEVQLTETKHEMTIADWRQHQYCAVV